MSVEIPIDTKYLPTNRASGRTTRDDEENEEENKMEEIIGKIWVYRMNALAVLIVGIGLLCFHKMIGSILNYEVLVPCICLVGMAVYCNVVCWIYTSWIQLPIVIAFFTASLYVCFVLFHFWKNSPISILFKVPITLVLLAFVGDLIVLALCACFMMQLCIKTPPKELESIKKESRRFFREEL